MIASAFIVVLVAATSVDPGFAQTSTDVPSAEPPEGVAVEQSASYSAVVAPALNLSLDRVWQELDASPAEPSPEAVKALTFRRRLLELRARLVVLALGRRVVFEREAGHDAADLHAVERLAL